MLYCKCLPVKRPAVERRSGRRFDARTRLAELCPECIDQRPHVHSPVGCFPLSSWLFSSTDRRNSPGGCSPLLSLQIMFPMGLVRLRRCGARPMVAMAARNDVEIQAGKVDSLGILDPHISQGLRKCFVGCRFIGRSIVLVACPAAQQAPDHRARCNRATRRGGYKAAKERA